ncbi:helix-turn-helix domain-containing protein [Fusibacter ferrireducens]|uniref:Helix-turn-helix transcriptional regulator n=1 Tax=Fusibacter ferrireducens TaxID=2785058 RepID=A0ABR9ZQ86_9FIRM|nr:helix-turn-helix domain-containing protein [Fusibacter ferrireducens]MBF4692633.1 helix-turn-helix transcriptional regulator [Fusibacter ferrireducens]
METIIGYYPILDMVLAFRELYSQDRFKPFNQPLETLESKLSADQLAFVMQYGDQSRGWLHFIEKIIMDIKLGLTNHESWWLNLLSHPEAYELSAVEAEMLFDIWQNKASTIITNYQGQIMWETIRISEALKHSDPFLFLTSCTDRFFYKDDETIHFNIKPDLEMKIQNFETIVLLPSVFGCRQITFWYHNSDFVFYYALTKPSRNLVEPSDMLLLTTQAFNDKTRLKLLRLLNQKSYSVNEMATILDVNASTISRHMKLFKDAGFVEIQNKDKNEVFYTLNQKAIELGYAVLLKYIQGEQ